MILTGLLAAAPAMPPLSAMAQTPESAAIGFDGVAETGNDRRPVRFRFFCSSSRGPKGFLSMEIELPRYESLLSVFDFGAFEGPSQRPDPLTLLRTTTAAAKAEDNFPATGSIIAGGISLKESAAFLFDVNPARKDSQASRKLAAVVRPLADGPGTVTWRQSSPKPGGSPIVALLDMTQPRVDQLKSKLSPCFPAR